jgi:hypothetical protein
MSSRRKIRAVLREACAQHLWMAVPRELEDEIVNAAASEIADEDVDSSPYGPLFELAVSMAHDYHGYGTFATAYDDVVVVLPIAHPEAFDDGEPGTYRVI